MYNRYSTFGLVDSDYLVLDESDEILFVFILVFVLMGNLEEKYIH